MNKNINRRLKTVPFIRSYTLPIQLGGLWDENLFGISDWVWRDKKTSLFLFDKGSDRVEIFFYAVIGMKDIGAGAVRLIDATTGNNAAIEGSEVVTEEIQPILLKSDDLSDAISLGEKEFKIQTKCINSAGVIYSAGLLVKAK